MKNPIRWSLSPIVSTARAVIFATGHFALFGMIPSGVSRGQAITEFILSESDSFPRDITSGSDGNLWFTEFVGNKIGRITTTGVITEFQVPTAVSGARDIAAGPDGNLWFTEELGNKIGRITTSGVIAEFAVPTSLSGPGGIAAGPDGNLWFTENNGNKIGRITTLGMIAEFALPTICRSFSCFPQSIVAGPDGNLWFTESGDFKIGRIATNGAITEFPIVRPGGPAQDIAAGSDGNLWFTEGGDEIGRITTDGVITEFSVPVSLVSANNITAGPDGNLWFTAFENSIGRITPAGVVAAYALPTASGAVGIASGPDGNIWFTEAGSVAQPHVARIGRITPVPPGPCVADSANLCLSSNGRFRVQTDWQVPSQGTSGHGTAVSLTADTGYFWFFQPSNVEMVVKVLDGCGINRHSWVFAGGLTNVEVTLTVTDTQTGEVKTYINPHDTAFLPVQDTAAFAACQ